MKCIPLSRRRALLAASPETRVRIYTLQNTSAWEAAQKRGYLTGDVHHADPHFLRSYGWMRFQMAERLTDFSGDFPVWAWLKRPNMRQWHYDPVPGTMVVAEVPLKRMLMSDFDAWHNILNNWWISINEREDEQLTKDECPVEDTWHRVFDILGNEPGIDRRWAGSKEFVQVCVDRIYLDEVVHTRPEWGRKGRNRRDRA